MEGASQVLRELLPCLERLSDTHQFQLDEICQKISSSLHVNGQAEHSPNGKIVPATLFTYNGGGSIKQPTDGEPVGFHGLRPFSEAPTQATQATSRPSLRSYSTAGFSSVLTSDDTAKDFSIAPCRMRRSLRSQSGTELGSLASSFAPLYSSQAPFRFQGANLTFQEKAKKKAVENLKIAKKKLNGEAPDEEASESPSPDVANPFSMRDVYGFNDSKIMVACPTLNSMRSTEKERHKDENKNSRMGRFMEINPEYWVQEVTKVENRFEAFVKTPQFDFVCALAIVGFMVTLGIETNLVAKSLGESGQEFFMTTIAFNSWFTIELLLRILSDRWDFVYSEDLPLNVIDVFLVLTSVIDLIINIALRGHERMDETETVTRAMRVIRICRAIRIVRLARAMQHVHQFRKMVCLIQGSLSTLFWCLFLLFGFVYTVSIILTQGVTDHLYMSEDRSDDDVDKILGVYYGTLPRSMNSLFQSMTAGINWGTVYHPLSSVGWLYSLCFLFFICFSIFGVLNVMTSVFVESTMKSALAYRDLIVLENERNKEIAVGHLRDVFREMDVDGDGRLSREEMTFFLQEQTVFAYLEALEINMHDADALFMLIDGDSSGYIDIAEFCEGCLKIKGQARAFDVHCMIFEINRFLEKWSDFTAYTVDRFATVEAKLEEHPNHTSLKKPVSERSRSEPISEKSRSELKWLLPGKLSL